MELFFALEEGVGFEEDGAGSGESFEISSPSSGARLRVFGDGVMNSFRRIELVGEERGVEGA